MNSAVLGLEICVKVWNEMSTLMQSIMDKGKCREAFLVYFQEARNFLNSHESFLVFASLCSGD